MPGSNGKVSNAIAVIEEYRKIHEEWVRKYDEVLEVLRSVQGTE